MYILTDMNGFFNRANKAIYNDLHPDLIDSRFNQNFSENNNESAVSTNQSKEKKAYNFNDLEGALDGNVSAKSIFF